MEKDERTDEATNRSAEADPLNCYERLVLLAAGAGFGGFLLGSIVGTDISGEQAAQRALAFSLRLFGYGPSCRRPALCWLVRVAGMKS